MAKDKSNLMSADGVPTGVGSKDDDARLFVKVFREGINRALKNDMAGEGKIATRMNHRSTIGIVCDELEPEPDSQEEAEMSPPHRHDTTTRRRRYW
jgi:hypothetical protein